MGGHRAERGNESNKEQEDPSAEGHGAVDAYVEVTFVTDREGWLPAPIDGPIRDGIHKPDRL